jgi:hypothetical protein
MQTKKIDRAIKLILDLHKRDFCEVYLTSLTHKRLKLWHHKISMHSLSFVNKTQCSSSSGFNEPFDFISIQYKVKTYFHVWYKLIKVLCKYFEEYR